MIQPFRTALLIGFTLVAVNASAAESGKLLQSPLNQNPAATKSYPKIVLYSTSWCPHCREAKEYLTSHNIPFINRDVELDPSAMTALTVTYKSQGVPVIVIGNDARVLKGFNRDIFEKAVSEVQKQQ
jgi:glutaredoxin-like YruB-family protein